jgi:MFS family permease
MPAGAPGLLRANGPFHTLIAARVISYTGDTLSLVALMLHVAATTGHAIAVALLLLVGDFAPALLSPLTGAISDRLDRGHVMIACELAQAACLLAIATLLPVLPVLLALVALRATLAQIFQPASRAAMPSLVPDPELERANSILGFTTNGAEAAGPFLAALLLPLLGIRGVLLADAVSFVVSAALLTLLPALKVATDRPAPLLMSARAGLSYLWSTPPVRVIIVSFAVVVAFIAIDDVAVVYLVRDTLHAPDSSVGWILAAAGTGILAGFLVLARHTRRLPLPALLLAGFAVTSTGNLLSGLSWAVYAAVLCQGLRGLGIAAIDVASNTLLQRLVPAQLQGRVFANLYGAVGIAAATSYIAGGLLLDATNARVTFIAAGTGALVTTAAAALALASGEGPRGHRRRSR